MRKPTRLSLGKAASGREASDASTDRLRRVVATARVEEGMDATREALPVAWHAPTDSPRGSGRAGQGGGEARSTGEAG